MITIIVFEGEPCLAGELQAELCGGEESRPREPSGTIRVLGCRTAEEVARLAADSGRGVVVADLAVGEADVMRFLDGWRHDWPVLVVGPAEAAALEWSLRELGALDLVLEPFDPRRLAGLCRQALGAQLSLSQKVSQRR